LRVRIKTVPLKQWEVGRELRRRILKAFEEHGIDIPTPAVKAAVSSNSAKGPLPPPPAAGPATPGLS
jgi:small conductance mechanosensitive channel